MSGSERHSPGPFGIFDLVDHDGNAVSQRSFAGTFVLYFFGFTHCRMVCPRALARLTAVLDRLGPLADHLRPVYITVDPERDTPEMMKAFLEEDYPRFTGLTGTRAQIDAAMSAFRVFARRTADPADPDGYQMPHSAFTYVMAPDGGYVTHFTDAVGAVELEQRLAAILAALDRRQPSAVAARPGHRLPGHVPCALSETHVAL